MAARFPEVPRAHEFTMLAVSRHERTDPQTHLEVVSYHVSHESVRFAAWVEGIKLRDRERALELIGIVQRASELGDDWETTIASAKRRLGTEMEEPSDAGTLTLDLVDPESLDA